MTGSGLSFWNGALDYRRLPTPFPLPTSTTSSPKSTALWQPSATHSHAFPKVTIAGSEVRMLKSTSTGRDNDL